MPFFLGAFGVLGLDGFMGVQFLMYGSNEEDDESFIGEDDDSKRGRSKWKRVHGWMRGWIPSSSPPPCEYERRSTPLEGSALLGQEHGRYGTV